MRVSLFHTESSRVRWLRPIAWIFAVSMLVVEIGHTIATIVGQTVPSVHFARPAPAVDRVFTDDEPEAELLAGSVEDGEAF